jgi:hypothetical protein
MAFSIEAIIALVSIVVSLPPAVLIIWKIHQRYEQKKDNTRGMATPKQSYRFIVAVTEPRV